MNKILSAFTALVGLGGIFFFGFNAIRAIAYMQLPVLVLFTLGVVMCSALTTWSIKELKEE